ncbi:MarR family winged helix-turn-helix transcriptional regulator [Amycolatopsis anabasis]|uniref:MarR family winged helix-turn-helix transcriptional regulator n=1 Tax=Amycolatopsis anabasis TaxID=1840409 RepID=UPI00131E6DA3|nr:MarR family transcriptional regulator [Amycolatopsis anabasis]
MPGDRATAGSAEEVAERLPPDEWPLGRLLATAARLLRNAFDADLVAVGLNHAGFVALHVLREGALSQAELARRCQVQAQTMSRTVDRLLRYGFVRRERDQADARRLLVSITSAGRRAYRRAPGRDSAHALGMLADPDAFRAELVRLVLALQNAATPRDRESEIPRSAAALGDQGG